MSDLELGEWLSEMPKWLNDCGESHDELEWDAFRAGFDASGEGFNGEYVHRRFRGRDGQESPEFLARMREEFETWQKTRSQSPPGGRMMRA